MFTFGTKIILLLLLIGGAIAIIGNYIGRAIGRRRLTIFNLRPRYTAFAITILTGILIVFSTMGIILAVSQDARTALFGLEELRKDLDEKSFLLEKTKNELALRVAEKEQIDKDLTAVKMNLSIAEEDLSIAKKDLTAAKMDLSIAEEDLSTAKKDLTVAKRNLSATRTNLSKAQREITALEKTKEKLGKEIEVSRKGKVLFKVGEVLLTSVIQAGPDKKKLEAGLKQILSAADAYVRSFGVEKALPAGRQEKHLIFVPPEEFDRAISVLQNRRSENIVMITATRNTLFGEEVPVRFDISENKMIYRSGENIAETAITPSLSVPEIEQEIKKLLSITHLSAKKAGVLPDASGSVGSIPYSKIYALSKKINAYKKGVKLVATAKEDTLSIGPLEVDFKIFYQ